jgi:hypothetical protein
MGRVRQALERTRPLSQNHLGLAVFAVTDRVRTADVPFRLLEFGLVGDRFTVTPRLPTISVQGQSFLLTLTQDRVRLLKGTALRLQPVGRLPRGRKPLRRTQDSSAAALSPHRPSPFLARRFSIRVCPGGKACQRRPPGHVDSYRIARCRQARADGRRACSAARVDASAVISSCRAAPCRPPAGAVPLSLVKNPWMSDARTKRIKARPRPSAGELPLPAPARPTGGVHGGASVWTPSLERTCAPRNSWSRRTAA